MSTVSGNRPVALDHLPKRAGLSKTQPRMAVINYGSVDSASCNCGWSGSHQRPKVLEDKIDQHLKKRHAGSGIRL